MNDKFKNIYVRYYKMLYYIALKIVNDEYLAEDVVQSMFTDFYDKRRVEMFDDIESEDVRRYLARSISNKSVDFLRKREKETYYVEQRLDIVNEMTECYTVEMSVEDAINCRKLIHTIKELPQIYYDVLVEHTLKGKTCNVVAKQAGIGTETVRKRVYRARKLLKQKLAQLNEAEGF